MRQLVLLGASNLTLAFPQIARIAAAGLAGAGPVRILAAAGHGRAYALPSRVLGRQLPAIDACGLWRQLASEPGLQTRAIVADIGNDLAFGAEVEKVIEAVGRCLERLRAAGAETLVVLPPLAGIERLSPMRFAVLRAILFPGRALDQGTIIRRLYLLAAGIRLLAAGARARTAEVEPEWLGGDGIHIRWRQRRTAWRSILAGWRPAADGVAPTARLRWSWRRADQARLLAMPLQHAQPWRRLADGSTLACY